MTNCQGLLVKDYRWPGETWACHASNFNGHLWHGGTRNRSGGHRRAVQCSFGRGAAR